MISNLRSRRKPEEEEVEDGEHEIVGQEELEGMSGPDAMEEMARENSSVCDTESDSTVYAGLSGYAAEA